MDPDVESAFPQGIQRLSQIIKCVRRFGGDGVGGVRTKVVVIGKPGGVENPDEHIGKPGFGGLREALAEIALKESEKEKGADAFDAEEIFGGKDAADLKKQGDDGVGFLLRAQSFERKAEGKQVKNERNEFLIDVRQRHPVLAVTGEDEHQERGEIGERPFGGAVGATQGRFALMEDLRERPPCRDADQKTDDEREDLPGDRVQRDDACGEIKNGSEEGAERHEGRDELGGTEKFGDPGEGPVVPVEAGEGEE